jgi:hypothetical protein
MLRYRHSTTFFAPRSEFAARESGISPESPDLCCVVIAKPAAEILSNENLGLFSTGYPGTGYLFLGLRKKSPAQKPCGAGNHSDFKKASFLIKRFLTLKIMGIRIGYILYENTKYENAKHDTRDTRIPRYYARYYILYKVYYRRIVYGAFCLRSHFKN